MKVTVRQATPIKKTVGDIKDGEAFRYNNCWYIRTHINDDIIGDYSDFYEEHALQDMPFVSSYEFAIPCIHLGSQSFCYANATVEVESYGTLDVNVIVAT